MVALTSLGGAGTVTGSKHLIEQERGRLVIDCGLFQGRKELRELNLQPLPTPASTIDAAVLTHAHLDHCGYLPRLVKDGFEGPIDATPATIDVAKLILRDSAFLQENDAEFANRHGFQPPSSCAAALRSRRGRAGDRSAGYHYRWWEAGAYWLCWALIVAFAAYLALSLAGLV